MFNKTDNVVQQGRTSSGMSYAAKMLTLSEIIAKETGASVIVVCPKSELLIARGEGETIVQPETQD